MNISSIYVNIWAKLAEILLINRGNHSTVFTKAQQENRLFIISTGEHAHLNYLSDRHSQTNLICSSLTDQNRWNDY
ncbi:hypothetical protein PL8927_730011 [Planktothrix serta PCC 8927]|uniref:Uncharacterized protein n=1 Tax=Planktothrix serta PCC 8927 TaxID=671068 RepID=A0A7Z9BZ82_9CYAN|nr:hypothetical protein PL8927_730011 [Planktothrix serta PCC 8927]